jgi:hypothetical protein
MRLLMLSLIGLPALWSCSSQPVQQPTSLSMAPAPATNTCALANTEGATCVRRLFLGVICHAFVGVTSSGDLYVYPHILNVTKASGLDVKRTLVWHLVDPRLQFTMDDGPYNFTRPNQFENGGPTNDPDGGAENPGPKRRYRVTFLNTVAAPNDYHIAVRKSDDGTVLTCDPRITNNAD